MVESSLKARFVLEILFNTRVMARYLTADEFEWSGVGLGT